MPIKQECIAWASTNFGFWRIKNRLDKPLLGRTVEQEGQWDSSSLPKLCGALPAPCSVCSRFCAVLMHKSLFPASCPDPALPAATKQTSPALEEPCLWARGFVQTCAAAKRKYSPTKNLFPQKIPGWLQSRIMYWKRCPWD